MDSHKPETIRFLRWQSGYFGVDGLAPMVSLIQSLATRSLPISCVLGSNGGETSDQDVANLADLIGCPRADAKIGILSYTTGLFHPKVYHLTRLDGSQTAYVGSANLTLPGVTGLNVEAGIILDSSDGEPPRVYRRAKLSENCPLWNMHKRRRPRSPIRLSFASVRCG
ncbi:MAG: restriction endonuclease PLD domain-containing protein, partial [Paracoccaceae bacterium]